MKHLLLPLAFFVSLSVSAQSSPLGEVQNQSLVPASTTIALQYQDKLNALKADFKGWEYKGSDTLTNPYYFRVFSSQTRYDSPLAATIGSIECCNSELEEKHISAKTKQLDAFISKNLSEVYAGRPSLISYVEEDCDVDGLREDVNKEMIVDANSVTLSGNSLSKDIDMSVSLSDEPLEAVVKKPNFWSFPTNFSLQFMQYYVTDNWHKGGESNLSLLANLVANANYDNKRNLTFENKLEMKLGFQSNESDDYHKYKTNADLLRLTNKLGLKAAKHWYYTAMLQSWTQFYKTYDGNQAIKSDFMSPFESLLSLGMEYKLEKEKFSIEAVMSPLAANFKYVDRDTLTTSHGLKKEDGNYRFDFGSTATVITTWNICKQVKWESRIYFFTNYHKTQVDWENTFTLSVNKYLSTNIFLNPRFDDGVKRKLEHSNFEFNEWVSVGLNLNF